MPRRVNLQREADLARLAALYLQGKSQVEIGLELRISQPQVSRNLATLQRRWPASSLLDFDAAKPASRRVFPAASARPTISATGSFLCVYPAILIMLIILRAPGPAPPEHSAPYLRPCVLSLTV